MKAEIKKQFIPKDYEVLIQQKLHNLNQRDMDVSTYTQEFHNLTLREKVYETNKQNLARYINGLKYSIQDELTLVAIESIHQYFNLALKIEEKHKRRGESSRGRGSNFRGRGGRFQGRNNSSKEEGKSQNSENESSNRGTFRGRRSNNSRGGGNGRGRGGNVFTGKCFTCNQTGH